MSTIEEMGIKKLGFGLMRLPQHEDKTIDIKQTADMADAFLAAGMNYFDTAYVYEGSEEAIKKALVERHPRDNYFMADKLNVRVAKSADEAKKQFETSLERTGAGYFDLYLMHALSRDITPKFEEYGLWEFAKELRAQGKIRHLGFSFHDKPDLLKELLEQHPEVEFVQLPLNYADWESLTVCSRENYELCRQYGKPVIVMEPVRGGALAKPIPQIANAIEPILNGASPASIAIRFAASLEGVITVLSGMSDMAQMQDNLSYMKEFKPLTDHEKEILAQVQDVIKGLDQIPCTACRYCTAGCPVKINIPGVFGAMNRYKIFGSLENAKRGYKYNTSGNNGLASSCIACGQCEMQCPQHIEIIKELQEVAAVLE